MRNSTWLSSLAVVLALVSSNGKASASTPVVVNPGFESDGTGVASPAGWSSVGSVNASFTEFGGHSGSLRLSHWSTDAYSVDTVQTVRGLSSGDSRCGHGSNAAPARTTALSRSIAATALRARLCRSRPRTNGFRSWSRRTPGGAVPAPSRCTRPQQAASGRTSTTSSSRPARPACRCWEPTYPA